MPKTRLLFFTGILFASLGLFQCSNAPSDGEADAGEGAQGGSSGTSSGSGASGRSAGSSSTTGGAAGTGDALATGGSSGGAGTSAGVSGSAGTLASGGTPASGGTSGCNAEPTKVAEPPPAAVDESKFTADWPSLACAAMKPCCELDEVAYDEAACLAHAAAAFDKTDKLYDANQAALCVQSLTLEAASCDVSSGEYGLPEACLTVYRGNLPPGSGCIYADECAPDPRGLVTCDFGTASAKECTVVVHAKLGDRCDVGCAPKGTVGACTHWGDPMEAGVEATCFVAEGLTCEPEGGRFDAPRICQKALGLGCRCYEGTCDGVGSCEDDFDAVCKPRTATAATCRLNDDCSVNDYCPDSTGSAVCTPRKKAGEACTYGFECLGDDCSFEACVLDNGDARDRFRPEYCGGG